VSQEKNKTHLGAKKTGLGWGESKKDNLGKRKSYLGGKKENLFPNPILHKMALALLIPFNFRRENRKRGQKGEGFWGSLWEGRFPVKDGHPISYQLRRGGTLKRAPNW